MKTFAISPYAFPGLGSDVKKKVKHRAFTPNMVIKYVAAYLNIPCGDIKGSSRKDEIVAARHLAMYIINTELEYSLPKTAVACGRENHTTVLHALKTVRTRMEFEPDYCRKANQIIALLKKQKARL